MSLPVPLSVRIVTAAGDRHVARDLRDLRFRSTVPGGFASAQLSFHRPLSLQPVDVAYYGQVFVYDRSGQTVWAGRLEDPGRSAGSDGEVWQINAVGPSAHTRDRTVPLVYVDTDFAFERVDNQTPGGVDSVGASPGDPLGLDQWQLLRFPASTPVGMGSRVSVRYQHLWRAGQKLARVSAGWDAGVTDANYAVQAVARTDGSLGGGDVAATAGLNTVGGNFAAVIATDFPAANLRNTIEFRLFKSAAGSATISTDTYWAALKDIAIVGTRYNAAGTELLTAASYPLSTVLAHEVVADLLGRLLTQFDGANASITAGTHPITKLAWVDGVDAERVLAELMRLEPRCFWAAWEPNAAGRYCFEWATWPTSVRFDADVSDTFDSPGSADGLYDRVRVRWVDGAGRPRTTVRTQTVQVLADAGISREAFIDLGAVSGGESNANRAGDEFLAEHAAAPNQGTLTVARPLIDYTSGRTVYPWELPRLAPGSLIRVRGVLPRVDSLNASARDGVTVFRCVGAEFNASSASCQLELDSFAPTMPRQISKALRAQTGPPRR